MSVIDEIKSRVDIVDVISEQVALQRAGHSLRARCPFHAEKTPSFYVSPEKQSWYCFGACATGGDVFSFLMKRDGIEFGEALRILAQRAGVALGERRSPEEDEKRRRLLEANEAAAAYFHNALLHTGAARGARDYLARRGLDSATIEAFQLGYGPESWDGLKAHLLGRGLTEAELLEAGLLVEGERGAYDRFRGRLMFPIRDEQGRIVGFGGRALDDGESAGAKYINTPQTPMFNKAELLYALDRAKEAIRREKTAIVVEGYMDAIAAHQHQVTNVVASMGTALTERQIRLLERFKPRVLLALDADAAGIEATLRALREAEAAGIIRAQPASVHPADLPDAEFAARVQEWSRNALKRATVNFSIVPLRGKDPDEMIRNDRAAWDDAVAHARPFTEYVFELVAGRKDRTQPAQRAELLQELLPVVRLIKEPAHQAHYVQRLAALAQVSEKVVWSELHRAPRSRREAAPSVAGERPRCDPKEEFCLALLLRHPDLSETGRALPPDLFLLSEHRVIFEAWRAADDLEAVRRALPEELHPHLEQILARELPVLLGDQLFQAFQDCARRMEWRRLSAAKQASVAALNEIAAVNDARSIEEARAIWEGQAAPETTLSEEGAQARELARAIVEDMETGRRLHQIVSRPRATPSPAASPPDEVPDE